MAQTPSWRGEALEVGSSAVVVVGSDVAGGGSGAEESGAEESGAEESGAEESGGADGSDEVGASDVGTVVASVGSDGDEVVGGSSASATTLPTGLRTRETADSSTAPRARLALPRRRCEAALIVRLCRLMSGGPPALVAYQREQQEAEHAREAPPAQQPNVRVARCGERVEGSRRYQSPCDW
jgi:hypothetical protein